MSFKVQFPGALLLTIALFIVPLHIVAQNKITKLPTNSNGQIAYFETVSIPHTSQSVLFKRALNWIVGTKVYKFGKIGLLDNSFGRMIVSARFVFNNDEVFISLTADVKDNKAQLKVSRFDYNMQAGNIPLDNLNNPKSKEAKILIPQVSDAMKLLIKSFRDTMLSGGSKK